MNTEEKKETQNKDVSLEKMPEEVKLNFEIPDIKEFLKTGAQFGHPTKRWNPKMKKFIFTKRGDIHIIDLSQTLPLLENALKFLVSASTKGRVIFVATKRQASEVVKEEAIRSGAYYIVNRWPGGLFTNFKMVNQSLKRLTQLEEDFEKGIEGRTKFEISLMKKEWDRLNRLYSGVKTMDRKPKAIVIFDPNYEKNALREAQKTGIPVIAIIDTNSDPEGIGYPVPANDDAVKSIKLFTKLFADAVLQGNQGKGVVHQEKDFNNMDIKIVKKIQKDENSDNVEEVVSSETKVENTKPVSVRTVKTTKKVKDDVAEKGLLGKSREEKAKIKTKKSN